MSRGPQPFRVHPNSILALSGRDPALKKRIERARKVFIEDASSFEAWFKAGCGAAIQTEYRDYDLG